VAGSDRVRRCDCLVVWVDAEAVGGGAVTLLGGA
jgi:hypothetical protein